MNDKDTYHIWRFSITVGEGWWGTFVGFAVFLSPLIAISSIVIGIATSNYFLFGCGCFLAGYDVTTILDPRNWERIK